MDCFKQMYLEACEDHHDDIAAAYFAGAVGGCLDMIHDLRRSGYTAEEKERYIAVSLEDVMEFMDDMDGQEFTGWMRLFKNDPDAFLESARFHSAKIGIDLRMQRLSEEE